MFQQVSSLALLAVVSTTAPVHAMQIRGTISGGSRPSAPKTLVLIANPYSAAPADSATVVAIGTAARERLERNVGTNYGIVTRKQMNDALVSYGYSVDAILSPLAVAEMARSLSVRYYVSGTIAKTGGTLSVTARIRGSNLDVGHVVTVSGAVPSEVGTKLADALAPTIKALTDARECYDLSDTKEAKAVESANKAFKTVPNYGLAEYCLAELALKKDSVGAEAMSRLQNTVKSDPFSLVALSSISVIYQKQKDSVKVIETWQHMLRAAPTNKALLESAFKVFVSYNKPDAAMAVADSGISQDPMNPDWYDLRSNVCFAKEDYGCAIAALENVYKVDSTRVDTLFFTKILYAASLKPDTAVYMRYGGLALKKYPDNAGLLEEAAKAYAMAGQSDSAVAITKRLVAIDPSKTGPMLVVVQNLLNAGKAREAIQFAANIKQYGDEDAKNNYVGLMVQQMQKVAATQPADATLLVDMGEAMLSVGSTNQTVLVYTNYFYAVGLQSGLSDLSKASREKKSCDLAREEQTLLNKMEPAVTIAGTSTVAAIADYSKRMLPVIQSEKTAVTQMIGSFCK